MSGPVADAPRGGGVGVQSAKQEQKPSGKAPPTAGPSAPAPATKAARRGDAKSADGAKAPVVASGAANTGSGVSHLPDLRERSPAQVLFGTPVQKLATPAPRSVLNAAEGVRARFREIDEQLSRAWRAQDFIDVLQGITDADPIQREQLQRYVIDRALLRFMDLGDINKLADAVPDNPALRKIVVERLLHYAAHYDEIKTAYTFGSRLAPGLTNLPEQQRPKPDSHRQKEFASRCAAVIVEAMDIEPRPRALGEYLAALTREEGKAFALALGGEHDWRNVADVRELAKLHHNTAVAIDKVLAALNHAPSTATTTAIVKNLCLQIVPTDFLPPRGDRRPPLSPDNVAFAMAYVWYPNDHAQAKLAMEHVKDLLHSRKGVELMFGGASLWKMQLIFKVVRRYPGITAHTFAGYDGDPLRHPTVTNALARQFLGVGPTEALTNEQFDAVKRLSANLQTAAGENLIVGPAPEKAKREAIAAIIGDPKIKFDSANDNPFANEQLQKDLAPLYARAGREREYVGESLRNVAGLALGLTPKFPANWDISVGDVIALQQAIKTGADLNDLPPKLVALLVTEPLFGKDETILNDIVQTINKRADTHPPKLAIDFNVVFTKLGPVPAPAFRVHVGFDPERAEPDYEYIDNVGRDYPRNEEGNSLHNYLAYDELPDGVLYYTPHDGFFNREYDRNGVEKLKHTDTPAAVHRLQGKIDKVATYGLLAAGVAGLVVASGGLALAAGAAGTTGVGWKTYRGVQTVLDRAGHGQNIDPFAPGQAGVDARLMWGGLVTDTLTLLAFGATAGLTGLKALGAIEDAAWVSTAIRVINAGAALSNTTVGALSAKQLHDQWSHLSQEQREEMLGALLLSAVLTAQQVKHMMTPEPAEITPAKPEGPEPSGPKPGKLPAAIVVTRQLAGQSAGLIRTMHDLLTRLGFENLAKQFETELAIWADACAKPPKADEVRAEIIELAEKHESELGKTNIRGLKKALRSSDQSPSQGVNFGAPPVNDNAPVDPNAQIAKIAANGEFTAAQSDHTVSTDTGSGATAMAGRGKKGGSGRGGRSRGKGPGAPPAGIPPSRGGKRGKVSAPRKYSYDELKDLSDEDIDRRSNELHRQKEPSPEERQEMNDIAQITAQRESRPVSDLPSQNREELINNLSTVFGEYQDALRSAESERSIAGLKHVMTVAEKVRNRLASDDVTTEDLTNAANFEEDMVFLLPGLHDPEGETDFLRESILDTALAPDVDIDLFSSLLRRYALVMRWTDVDGWCGTESPANIINGLIEQVRLVVARFPDDVEGSELISSLQALQRSMRPPSGDID